MRYICKYDSPLGMMTMSGEGRAVTGLWFDGQKHFPSEMVAGCEERHLLVFDEAIAWLNHYFHGCNPGKPPFLSLRATPFRLDVWNVLQKIPYGKTVTYKEIAVGMARKYGMAAMSAQAVGGAVGHNPISIFIPCHRVLGSDGSLTGYAGGIDKKTSLLELEGVDLSRFTK